MWTSLASRLSWCCHHCPGANDSFLALTKLPLNRTVNLVFLVMGPCYENKDASRHYSDSATEKRCKSPEMKDMGNQINVEIFKLSNNVSKTVNIALRKAPTLQKNIFITEWSTRATEFLFWDLVLSVQASLISCFTGNKSHLQNSEHIGELPCLEMPPFSTRTATNPLRSDCASPCLASVHSDFDGRACFGSNLLLSHMPAIHHPGRWELPLDGEAGSGKATLQLASGTQSVQRACASFFIAQPALLEKWARNNQQALSLLHIQICSAVKPACGSSLTFTVLDLRHLPALEHSYPTHPYQMANLTVVTDRAGVSLLYSLGGSRIT